MRAARCFSTRTPSTLTSVSNLSTFMTQGEACKISSLKENRDRSHKVFCHAPPFAVPQSVVRSSSRCCSLHISNIYAKKKCIAKKLIQTLRAIMISQEVETISVLLMKPLLIVPCPRHWAPHHCGDPDPFRTTGQTSCGFLKPPGSQRFWKVNKHGAFSIPRKLFA